ncbi:MAG: SpaA isopeptide-forming pilin-related protein [Actinomycetaceae bacterium]|nr:SpaA isopeptide-forming pilin-related protein [Actinomycetaceae bacterium]MDU0970893.1 SpaA isopeptide-forming pilin-related protein [Actinomycetaceae bacterium]
MPTAKWETVVSHDDPYKGTLVAGAVTLDPANPVFYYAEYIKDWNHQAGVVRINKLVDRTIHPLGDIKLVDEDGNSAFPGEIGEGANGDMVFDSNGNLYLVLSQNNRTVIATVTASELAAAESGQTVTVTPAVVDRPLGDITGVAVTGDGSLAVANSKGTVWKVSPGTGQVLADNLGTNFPGSADLASCVAPSTIALVKHLDGKRLDPKDQFRLTLAQEGSTGGTTKRTEGSGTGDILTVGPNLAADGTTFELSEKMAVGSAYPMSSYQASMDCTSDSGDGFQIVQPLKADGNTNTAKVKITKRATRVVCTITNNGQIGHVTWTKVDGTDKNPLPGTVWTLTGPGGSQDVTDCTADGCTGLDQNAKPGEFKLDLPYGEYTLVEKSAPDGYVKDSETHKFTVDADHTTVDLKTIENTRIPGSVAWTKVDGTGKLLGGSEWTLDGPNADKLTVTDCVADSADKCTDLDKDPAAGKFLVKDLAWGVYTLVEKSAPTGYVKDGKTHEFGITPTERDYTFSEGFKNEAAPGSVTWIKRDEDGNNLAGTAWTLTGPDNKPLTVNDCTTGDCKDLLDKDPAPGKFKVEGLAWGKWTLKEYSAPTGYDLVEATYDATIKADDLHQSFGIIVDKYTVGNVTWSKVVKGSTDKFLAGSVWELSGPNGEKKQVEDCTVEGQCNGLDKDPAAGKFRVEGLRIGDWTMKETTAPAGYVLDQTPHKFTIIANESVDAGAIENSPVTGPHLPNTGGTGTYSFFLTSIAALLAGTGVAFAATRKRMKA